jgi:hypothetical protein
MTDPRKLSTLDLWLAWGLGLLTFLGLWKTEGIVGVPRDESFYFHAGSDYARWWQLWWDQPGQASQDDAINRAFAFNNEHPALMKELFGLSHHFYSELHSWLRPIAAYRMPSWALAGIFAAALFSLGRGMKGRGVGVLAVLLFFLSPRNWYHAHLAAFDFPICAMWLITVYGYWRGQTSKNWAIATGALFGLALATKHNAFFIPPTLVLHWLVFHGVGILRKDGLKALWTAIPISFWSMALLGPVVFYAHWPLMWHHPTETLKFWINFHLQHNHYAWYYLGNLMREPPFPIEYPFVVTAMTVPLPMVVAMATAYAERLVAVCRGFWSSWASKDLSAFSDDGLLLLNGLISIAIIAQPEVPHFGGEKHWMPSMPFLCILGGVAIMRAADALAEWLPSAHKGPIAAFSLSALVVAPGVVGLGQIGGYGTGYYNELTEGQPGAAALGMQRMFWSNDVTGVLDWLNDYAPTNAKVFFHEVTYDSYRAYIDNGMVRKDIRYAGLGDADIACYQYHQEFRFWEYNLWNSLQTQWPVHSLYVDEVPHVECFQRGYK